MKKTLISLTLAGALFSGSVLAAPFVTVNGQAIDQKILDEQVKAVNTQTQGNVKDTPELRENLKMQIVANTLIIQEAKKLGLDKSAEYKQVFDSVVADAKKQGLDKKPEYKQDIENIKEELLVRSYMADVLKKNPVTDQEVKAVHSDIVKDLTGTQEVKLSQIITNSDADAKKALTQLNQGKKFADVAKAVSLDPAAKTTGGLIDTYTNLKEFQQAAPEIYAAVNPLSKNAYTKAPVKLNNVYVLFQVNDKRKAVVPKLEEIKGPLTGSLQKQKIDESVQALFEKASIK
ncbi:MAG: peptidyl-prolyl cis-trans isomerase [Neisseriaceae bacterium]|nr:peptidyl-prolyl cis-trans isomerase [Neisseriaceae bacterium]